jgi:hypothetical protein
MMDYDMAYPFNGLPSEQQSLHRLSMKNASLGKTRQGAKR